MPSALLRARPWSVILASALPLYALSACELFLGDVTDPAGDAGKVTGPIGAAGHGGATGSMGGGAATGADSSAPGGGTAGTSSGGRGGGGAGGLGTGGIHAGGASGNGGSGTSGGAPGAGGAGTGGLVRSGGAPGTGGGAAGGAPGSGGAGGCCDCDGDTVKAMGACGGTDCDDDDVNVFPGQTLYFETPSKHRGFDYNCVNGAERDPSLVVTVDCSHLLGIGCDPGTGYFSSTKVVPACGVSGAWGVCAKPALSCVQNKIEDRVMACH